MQPEIESSALPANRVIRTNEIVRIRVAKNSDGNAIYQLVTDNGFSVDGLDWNDIEPYWLVCEHEGDIVGTIQVAPSKPIGRLEMLSVDKTLSHTLRAIVVVQLLIYGSSTLKAGGSQMASGLIPFEEKSYKKILKKHGCVSLGIGNLMAKRL